MVSIIVLAVGAASACAVEAACVGLQWESSLAAPRLDRLNPFAGMRRFASEVLELRRTVVRLSVTVVLLGGFFPFVLRCEAGADPFDVEGHLALGAALIERLVRFAGGVMIALGAWDYMVRRRKLARDLSMSVDEARRESRDEEGDPLVRSVRRALHEELSMNERIARIRRSRVVVVEKG